MILFAKNIYEHFLPLKVLVGVNIRTTVLSTRLGWLWWVLDPLFLMAIYYFLIKGIFGRGGENYHVFVLIGVVSWQFFSRSLTDCMAAILSNKNIIQQISFPLPILVLIPIVVRFFFALIGMLVIISFQYSLLNLNFLAVVPVLIVIGLYSFGFGLILSVISVYVGDVKQLVAYVLRAGFFVTPILYPASRLLDSPTIPEIVKSILQLNPMMWLITALRDILMLGKGVVWTEYFLLLAIGLLLVQFGITLMRKKSSDIIKLL